jgi:hypothetical protein
MQRPTVAEAAASGRMINEQFCQRQLERAYFGNAALLLRSGAAFQKLR